jgi:hypothetical protein
MMSEIIKPSQTKSEKAEVFLASRYPRVKAPSKKVAGFTLPSGRHIAVEHRLGDINVWTENAPRAPSRDPSTVYPASRTRNGHLAAQAPRLAFGNEAICWRVSDVASLPALLGWYEST